VSSLPTDPALLASGTIVPEDVHVGAEGHLFLYGGHHQVRDHFTGVLRPGRASVAAFFANAEKRTLFCERRGIGYRGIVFPEKLAALAALVELPVVPLYRDAYLPAAQRAAPLPLYPLKALGDPRHFKKTDTHLSHSGEMLVLGELLADRFAEWWADFREHVRGRSPAERFLGDLGRKFDPPIKEKTRQYAPLEHLSVEHNGVRGMNDGTMVIVENRTAVTPRRLLIFGDSFFRAMLPKLAYFYQTVIFCRSRFFHYELVESVRPDDIFTGTAERYLSHCESDAERSHFLLVPMAKGKLARPTPGFPDAFARTFDRRALL
jgi:hypothetical protein